MRENEREREAEIDREGERMNKPVLALSSFILTALNPEYRVGEYSVYKILHE